MDVYYKIPAFLKKRTPDQLALIRGAVEASLVRREISEFKSEDVNGIFFMASLIQVSYPPQCRV